MTACIVGVLGPFETRSFPIEDELTIGRDSSNRVCVNDYSLSRRHCSILLKGDNYVLRDLGSHNGTFVNRQLVTEVLLKDGDRIQVGGSVFQFSLVAPDHMRGPATVSFEELTSLGSRSEITGSSSFSEEALLATSLPRERLARDYAALLAITTRLRGIRSSESLQWQLAGVILELIPAERVVILLGEDSSAIEPAFAWDKMSGPGQPVKVSRTIVQRVLSSRAPLLLNDVPLHVDTDSVKALQVQSVLCVPICTPEKLIGAIYLDVRSSGVMFDSGHLFLMTAVATSAALALENARHFEALQTENEQLKREVVSQFEMVGDSVPMQELYRFIAKAAPTDASVLIFGESGTGKELVARALHRHSRRADKPFVAVNCAAITETLLETELFGHEKGAFTGAVAQKRGYLEVAEGGTIFLDEVAELAPSLQAKLLRVLQEREVLRVGGTSPIKVDIRVLAATNKNLSDLVKQGAFREDLFYRLNVVSCKIAPLRERREDISLLAEYFLSRCAAKCKRQVQDFSEQALDCLHKYDWPGNVRELENAIERAVVLGSTRQVLRDDLPESLTECTSTSPSPANDYHSEIARRKKQLIRDALHAANGSFTEAAKQLGIHPNYLHRLVSALALRQEKKKSGT